MIDTQEALWLAVAAGAVAIVYGVFVVRWILAQPAGSEKMQEFDAAPFGVIGLETALGLLWQAVDDGRLTVEDLVLRMHAGPRRIYGLAEQPETWIEVDPKAAWEVRPEEMLSRCGWSPYEGMRLPARVRRVSLRGSIAYDDGRVLSAPGSGVDLRASSFPEA